MSASTRRAGLLLALCLSSGLASVHAQVSNLTVRAMAANITSGTQQSYEAPGIRIFQGLKPDIVAIQEFQVAGLSSSNTLRTLVDDAFGTNFYFYCEPNNGIPNGVVSRWPILAAGTWEDTQVADRGFVWAQIDLPGTNDLYVISVHLHSSGGASSRAIEATNLKNLIQTNLPTNSWMIVAGDFNTTSRAEACMNTFTTFLSDEPIPHDLVTGGNPDTNEPRNNPYDYVLPSFNLTNYLAPVVIGPQSFTRGLVFDSTVYNNNYGLGSVTPVQSGDSHVTGMQHMAVVKNFLLPVFGTNSAPAAPVIIVQPQPQTNGAGVNVQFSVTANGTVPLAHQWRFFGTNLPGATATNLALNAIATNDAGPYTVVITNLSGSVTSQVATLTVTNAPALAAPGIVTQPQPQTNIVGANVQFIVVANGTAPLAHQWRFFGTNLPGATATNLALNAITTNNAGPYTVVITNLAGSVTSSVATLTVTAPAPASTNIITQWNFNSAVNDANPVTGSTNTFIGSGLASLIGGVVTNSSGAFGTGAGNDTNTTDNSAWISTGYPTQGTANKSAGARFVVSTAGRQDISVAWADRSSGSGTKYVRLQYTTDGTNYADFPTASVVGNGVFTFKTNNLAGLPGVNNNTNFAFQIVAEFESTAGFGTGQYVGAGGAYATGGTLRFDMVTVYGSLIPAVTNPPALPPALTNLFLSNNVLSFTLTGTPGTNYIVQASTNLALTNWLALRTNAAPFTFSETNPALTPQKFFRGQLAP